MNPYYYLYYKLSRFINRKGGNEWGAMYALSFLIFINIIVLYVNLFHITEENSKGVYKIGIIAIGIGLFIINYIIFLYKDRHKQIAQRYKDETMWSKNAGGFLVILYVVVTLASIIIA